MIKRRVCWLLCLITFGALHLFGHHAGTFALLTAAAVLPFLSALILLAAARLSRLHLSFILPDFCVEGEEISGRLRLSRAWVHSVLGASCQIVCTNLHTDEQTGAVFSFHSMRGYGADIGVLLQPLFSGTLQVTAQAFTLYDPLGLFAKRVPLTQEHRIQVLPDGLAGNTELAESPDSLADNDEYSMTRPGSDPGEIYAVRPYVPGDPLRSIHWKLTEKLDKVMVREFGRPLARQPVVPPEASAVPEARSAATGGVCLCRRVTTERRRGFLWPPLIAVLSGLGMTGALAHLLAVTIPRTFAGVSLGTRTIPEGFLLLANRLFSLSEQRQSYLYKMFAVTAAENADAYSFLAFMLISAAVLLYAAVTVWRKSVPLCLAAMLTFTGVQIYFGVFVSPVRSVLLYAALLITALYCAQKDAGAGFLAIAPALAAVCILALAWYPGDSPFLAALSESIRDRFDEKVERPLTEVLNRPALLADPQRQETRMRPEPAGAAQTGASAYATRREERFAGSQAGTAAGRRMWVLWLILALFAAGFGGWVLVRLRRAAKQRAVFDAPDCAAAIHAMFLLAMRWLTAFGLPPETNMDTRGGRLETSLSASYAQAYLAARALWLEAVYSDHTLTQDDRAFMRTFLHTTAREVSARAGLPRRAVIRLRLLFSEGGAA